MKSEVFAHRKELRMKTFVQLLAILLDWSKWVRRSRATIVVASLAGMVSGLASTAVIAVVNAALNGAAGLRPGLARELAALCVVIPLSGFLPQALLARLPRPRTSCG
jgi:ABC-type siderophore export system fused ATPase/permease subunit